MKTEKTHRRYPEIDWDYKAISSTINDAGTKRKVIYHTLTSKGKKTEGVEVLSGANYIVGSKDRSNYRSYSVNEVPAKYKDIIAKLKAVHKNTEWSSAKYVDEN